jgi:hypothetical protein
VAPAGGVASGCCVMKTIPALSEPQGPHHCLECLLYFPHPHTLQLRPVAVTAPEESLFSLCSAPCTGVNQPR